MDTFDKDLLVRCFFCLLRQELGTRQTSISDSEEWPFSYGQNKDYGNSAIFHIEIKRKDEVLHRMVKMLMLICRRFVLGFFLLFCLFAVLASWLKQVLVMITWYCRKWEERLEAFQNAVSSHACSSLNESTFLCFTKEWTAQKMDVTSQIHNWLFTMNAVSKCSKVVS